MRFVVWLAVVVAGGIGLLALARAFPDRTNSDYDTAYLIRLVAILVLVSTTFLFGRNIPMREVVHNILIWLTVAAVLAIGFTYQDEIRDMAMRVRAELIPDYPVSNAHELILTRSGNGNFYVYGTVNGVSVKFLIDTGASDVTLSPADAQRLGIDLNTLDFSQIYDTANGAGRGAFYTVRTLSIGALELSDVSVSINQTPMRQSLLGMTFLSHLASVELRGRKLILHWRR
ncbi:MAG TPA: TIGR02281 family clan AA aspartic protease [Rhizomicrobium sp.]|nr:TIGR02281 family clan AA aspartic protease [Rhizomicrobium sp.]